MKRALLVLAIVAVPLPAPGARVAVGVSSGWKARAKMLGVFLRYEMWYRRSAVFKKGAKHAYFPRSFGLGTRIGQAHRELIIKVPSFGKKETSVVLKVSVRARKKVPRLLHPGKKWKWVPVSGWKKRKVVVDLGRAAGAVIITKAAARREIRECFQKLRAYKKKHPKLGALMLKSFEKTLDVSEEGIVKTIRGMVESRYVAAKVLEAWTPPALPNTLPPAEKAQN